MRYHGPVGSSQQPGPHPDWLRKRNHNNAENGLGCLVWVGIIAFLWIVANANSSAPPVNGGVQPIVYGPAQPSARIWLPPSN